MHHLVGGFGPVPLTICALGDMATDAAICREDIHKGFLVISKNRPEIPYSDKMICRRNLKGKSVEGDIRLRGR